MNSEEREYIKRYRDYKYRHLPQTETLAGLWADDFDRSVYPDLDYVSVLWKYLEQLGKYSNVLVNAAGLRQEHYEKFIAGQKEEDEGHMFWREGMNSIARDSMEKLEYWKNVHENAFGKEIQKFNRRENLKSKVVYVTAKDVDPKPKNITDIQRSRTIIQRPRLSKAQKKKREREIKKRKETAKAHKDAEETKILDKLSKRHEEKFKNVQLCVVKDSPAVHIVTLFEKCKKVPLLWTSPKHSVEDLLCVDPTVQYHGTNREILKMADIMVENICQCVKITAKDESERMLNAVYMLKRDFHHLNLLLPNFSSYALHKFKDVFTKDINILNTNYNKLGVFISYAIWRCNSRSLVEWCRNVKKIDEKEPHIDRILKRIVSTFPLSFYVVSADFLDDCMESKNYLKLAFKINFELVTPPKICYKTINSFLGYKYVLKRERIKAWRELYEEFLKIVKE
jgi:hypothetical protein